ncbi:HAD family hydrolase [Caulobacter sp. S45]|uniref:HAD-IIIC family phosphatase n=1 Tax=Caulobacter sp. S45 TaxID=1641861 RepID=UPI001576B8EC|nr:HAD-IIIC family phosphatase [Caulobacter sp. S45]
MLVRRSRYVHLTRLGAGRVLAVHAMTQLRLVVDEQVAAILDAFAAPRDMPGELSAMPACRGFDPEVLAGCLATLMEHGLLTDREPAAEEAELAASLSDLHGRDAAEPDAGAALDALRRRSKDGADPCWSVTEAQGAAALGRPLRHRLDVLLFGDCELQMEADFLRREAARRGVALRVATAFPDDLRLASERPHDAILVGALRSRRVVAMGSAEDHGGDPAAIYVAEAQAVLEGLRAVTSAPILLDGLPEPTVQPLGFADRGLHGHRNRFRRVNLALGALVDEFADVHLVDMATALNIEGSGRLLDDALVGFTHFGGAGWMLQRPGRERAAVHGIVPDPAPLQAALGGDAYARERVAARAHMDALAVVRGIDAKKCVIVDLDGTLWPGVLAETGAPFAWTPEVSGAYSHIGLWFGIHEALLALKRRGVVLACVSKNDEALVRRLWRYDDHYPRERLLTPDDFVTWRVDWADKPSSIAAVAAELGFALDAFLFVDDHPVERERVRQALPEVEVWGEDLYGLRRRLLTDPRLQVPVLTGEATARTDLVKAQLGRDRQRTAATDSADFLRSLEVQVRVERAGAEAPLARVAELFARTTQFNTTGRRFRVGELAARAAAGELFIAHASDRFGDYGLVAAAVLQTGEVTGLVMSCRVIGLGVERALIDAVIGASGEVGIIATIVETERNGPVRNLYGDAGFQFEDGVWRRAPEPLRMAG